MKPFPPIIPTTNANTAKDYLEERELKKKVLDKLEAFHTDIEIEKEMARDNGDVHAIVEAPREVVEYINRGPKMIAAFDRVGYCLYHGVVVCETGKKDATIELLEGPHGSNSLSPHEFRVRQGK
jgi:hypothetical protein